MFAYVTKNMSIKDNLLVKSWNLYILLVKSWNLYINQTQVLLNGWTDTDELLYSCSIRPEDVHKAVFQSPNYFKGDK